MQYNAKQTIHSIKIAHFDWINIQISWNFSRNGNDFSNSVYAHTMQCDYMSNGYHWTGLIGYFQSGSCSVGFIVKIDSNRNDLDT